MCLSLMKSTVALFVFVFKMGNENIKMSTCSFLQDGWFTQLEIENNQARQRRQRQWQKLWAVFTIILVNVNKRSFECLKDKVKCTSCNALKCYFEYFSNRLHIILYTFLFKKIGLEKSLSWRTLARTLCQYTIVHNFCANILENGM
jgi:hypothetical protein